MAESIAMNPPYEVPTKTLCGPCSLNCMAISAIGDDGKVDVKYAGLGKPDKIEVENSISEEKDPNIFVRQIPHVSLIRNGKSEKRSAAAAKANLSGG